MNIYNLNVQFGSLPHYEHFESDSQGAGLPKYKFRSTQTTEKVWYLNMVEKDLLIKVR